MIPRINSLNLMNIINLYNLIFLLAIEIFKEQQIFLFSGLYKIWKNSGILIKNLVRDLIIEVRLYFVHLLLI